MERMIQAFIHNGFTGFQPKQKKPKRKRMENIQFQDTQTEPWMRRKQKNRTEQLAMHRRVD